MKRWLAWIEMLLMIFIVTAITTILINRKQVKVTEDRTEAVPSESAASMKYSGRWFRDELGLTAGQMREFQRFNPVFRQKVRGINIELAETKSLMLNEMTSEQVDTARLNSLSDSIGRLHSELKKATYLYYLEFKKIISSEQQERLRQIFSQMFEGEIPNRGGRGMQGAGRPGMQRRQFQNQ